LAGINFAAVDIFMCGRADPLKPIPVLQEAFRLAKITVHEYQRGLERSSSVTGTTQPPPSRDEMTGIDIMDFRSPKIIEWRLFEVNRDGVAV
jgi:S-adenosylmethionine decarboxylase